MGKLRNFSEKAFTPAAKYLEKRGISPNTITILGFAISVAACGAYTYRHVLLGAFFILTSGLLDVLDGAVARLVKDVTYFGATLDAVVDRYTEFFYMVGMALGGLVDWVVACFAMFSMIASSYARARAESSGGLKNCAVGIAERQEKIVILVAGSLLYPFVDKALLVSALALTLLGQITVGQRLYYTYWYNKKNGLKPPQQHR
ncbi:MAG: CDP-alcohol phosphatidyltransferase family protein [Thermoproteota archaeon]